MSVFRVKLNNERQGLLDVYDNQRSAYITGPNRTTRILKDGEIFTDCNYWKRFASPPLAPEEAFIEVLEDDGTIWSDSNPQNSYPKVYDLVAAPGSSFSANRADIEGDSGSWALFAQITNKGAESVRIRLNGMDTAIIDLEAGSTQVFNAGELIISLVEVENQGVEPVRIQMVFSIRAVSSS